MHTRRQQQQQQRRSCSPGVECRRCTTAKPTLYTEGDASAMQVQVENIHNDHKARAGVSTYQTTPGFLEIL